MRRFDREGPRRTHFNSMLTVLGETPQWDAASEQVEIEIIFPVASEAIAITGDAELPLVPGVAAGEGCSTAGGCATCPFMKMNTLDALMDVLGRVRGGDPTLAAYEPKKYAERLGGETVAAVGSQPILHMRAFQASGRLPDALIADIRGRAAS